MQDTYKATQRIEPVKWLIAALETGLGLIGALALILYFYTGSFAGAGQKFDAGLKALWLFIAPFLGQA